MPKVFISYVKEDTATVLRLASILKEAGIDVWLDKENIEPGIRWQDAIKKAICNGAFFIACFSSKFRSKNISYMNEEITIAIDQIRMYAHNKIWFIPILIDDTEVPDRRISSSENLKDLQYIDLSKNWHEGIKKVVQTIKTHSAKF